MHTTASDDGNIRSLTVQKWQQVAEVWKAVTGTFSDLKLSTDNLHAIYRDFFYDGLL